MDVESTDKLKLDLRLVRRRSWISPDELQRALEDLPDVSEKGVRGAPEAAAESPAGGAARAQEVPPSGEGA